MVEEVHQVLIANGVYSSLLDLIVGIESVISYSAPMGSR